MLCQTTADLFPVYHQQLVRSARSSLASAGTNFSAPLTASNNGTKSSFPNF